MPNDTTTASNIINELSDIKVETLGLVDKGAIGLPWFLTKRDGEEGEEGEPTQETSFLEKLGWSRLIDLINKGQQTEAPTGVAETIAPVEKDLKSSINNLLSEYRDELPSRIVSALERLAGGGGDGDDDMPMKREDTPMPDKKDTQKTTAQEETPATETKPVAETPKAQATETPPPATTEEGDTVAKSALAELEKRFEDRLAKAIEKSEKEREDLQKRLDRAEATASTERTARELAAEIAKAEGYPNLPIGADELGPFFYFLKSADEMANEGIQKSEDNPGQDWYGFVSELFKAVDGAMKATGVYTERGSSKVPASPTSIYKKAEAMVTEGKAENIREALLKLSPEEADQHLKEVMAE